MLKRKAASEWTFQPYVKAQVAIQVFCPGGCGLVMNISDDMKTMECTLPDCRFFARKFWLPTIDLLEVSGDERVDGND